MALPGLGLIAPTNEATTGPVTPQTTTPTTHTLLPETEWRFEVPIGNTISLKLLTGTAEIFGTELAVDKPYIFNSTKAAVYTWHGCVLEVTGSCEEYTAEETPMVQYMNVHFGLENVRRGIAAANNDRLNGPAILVVGPNNSGKTSLTKILTAYASKTGRQPLVVNTDNRESILSVPGSLTATVVPTQMDVEEGFGSSPTSGPSLIPVKQPLSYYYGLASPEDSPKLYKAITTRLALACTGRLTSDPNVKACGIIIDTPGSISSGKNSYELINHLISEFSVDIIITLGSERLHADLTKRFTNRPSGQKPLTVLKLDKSGGCVDRDEVYMSHVRKTQIRNYFFGTAAQVLSPTTFTRDFSALSILQIRENTSMGLAASFLPGSDEQDEINAGFGSASTLSTLEKKEANSSMLHALLAVMYAGPNDDLDSIRDAAVMGFVYVAEIDETRKKVKLLSPVAGIVDKRPLVWGSWPEGVGSLI